MIEHDERLAFSIDTLAAMIEVSASFIRTEIARNRIHATRLGKRVVVRREEAQRYLRDNETST